MPRLFASAATPNSRAVILRLIADHGRKHIGSYLLAAL